MRAAVLVAWVPFTGRLEGVVPWLYADILNLVTTAIGNLVDSSPAAPAWGPALSLPFFNPDGSPSTSEQIIAAFQAVKSDPRAAKQGHHYAKTIVGNAIRLTAEGVSRVVLGKLAANDRELARRFPDYPDWCADAQLFVHSMSWACGTGFRFPALERALLEQDFVEALRHCHINEDGPDRVPNTADDNWGLKPRNVANKIMLANAAKVQGYHLDPDELLFQIAGAELDITPAGHVPPRQDVSPLWEENTGSGGVVHAMPEWPSYRD